MNQNLTAARKQVGFGMNMDDKVKNWKRSRGIIALLGSFQRPRDSIQIVINPGQFSDLEIPIEDALHLLESEGAIVECTLYERVNYCFVVPELKKIAVNYGIKPHHRKPDLINSLLESHGREMEVMTAHVRLFKWTKVAEEAMEEFERFGERKFTELQKSVYDALYRGDVLDANTIYEQALRKDTENLGFYHRFLDDVAINNYLNTVPKVWKKRYPPEFIRAVQVAIVMRDYFHTPRSVVYPMMPSNMGYLNDEVEYAAHCLIKYCGPINRNADRPGEDEIGDPNPEED